MGFRLESRGARLNRGSVCTNWPSMVGSWGLRENTGASVVSPSGDQKPLVVQSVKGEGMPSSLTSANMLWYCADRCMETQVRQQTQTSGKHTKTRDHLVPEILLLLFPCQHRILLPYQADPERGLRRVVRSLVAGRKKLAYLVPEAFNAGFHSSALRRAPAR